MSKKMHIHSSRDGAIGCGFNPSLLVKYIKMFAHYSTVLVTVHTSSLRTVKTQDTLP